MAQGKIHLSDVNKKNILEDQFGQFEKLANQ
jgi:hypothetical protein